MRLVRLSVDALLLSKQRVSLSTIVLKSKELDPDHRGISESAILDNQEARAYYEQHRTWRGSSRKRARPLVVESAALPRAAKSGRDEQRARQRYLRMSKEAAEESVKCLSPDSSGLGHRCVKTGKRAPQWTISLLPKQQNDVV